MKFGNLLRNAAQEVPDLHNLWTFYKSLKKKLNRLPVRQRSGEEQPSVPAPAQAEQAVHGSNLYEHERLFVEQILLDVQQFNALWIEKEEQSVIGLRLLEDQAAAARTAQQITDVYKRFVDFHGQQLLLVHWSILGTTRSASKDSSVSLLTHTTLFSRGAIHTLV